METKKPRTVVWMQSSLDGRTSGPDGELDWPVVDGELHQHFIDTLRHAGLFVYGRKVFEMMASFWPVADELPGSTPAQAEYARIWRPMPKVVLSRTLSDPGWNAEVVSEVGPTLQERIAAADGDTYVFGGSTTVAELARQDLVDEYQVFVHPLVLGGGARLIPSLDHRQQMRLVEVRTFDDRAVGLRYARER